MLIESIQEGYRQGGDGPAQDDILINTSWGFKLQDIQADLMFGKAKSIRMCH